MQLKIALVLALCPAAAAVRLAKMQPLYPKDYTWAMEEKGKAHFSENQCRNMPTPQMCKPKPGQGQYTAAAVVSTFQEDLHWLNEMPWSDQLTVLVHNRSSRRTHESKMQWQDSLILAEESEAKVKALNFRRTSPVQFVDLPNQGDEAAAYLTWIIEHYSKLPDVTFFLQGHRCADHASFDMSVALPNIRQCFSPQQGYLDLNTYKSGSQTRCRGTREIVMQPIMGFHLEKFSSIWTQLFEKEFGKMPNKICWDSYAQFAVSRDLILRHPLEFYQKLHEGVTTGVTNMEFFWRAVFVPGALSNEPLPKKDRMGKTIKKPYEFSPEELIERTRVIDLAGQVKDTRR